MNAAEVRANVFQTDTITRHQHHVCNAQKCQFNVSFMFI